MLLEHTVGNLDPLYIVNVVPNGLEIPRFVSISASISFQLFCFISVVFLLQVAYFPLKCSVLPFICQGTSRN